MIYAPEYNIYASWGPRTETPRRSRRVSSLASIA